jgi:protein-L-isoaspartate(D-aspartate) O-methyltransferase
MDKDVKPPPGRSEGRSEEQDRLLRRIAEEFEETAQMTGRAAMSGRLREALIDVRREDFVPETSAGSAYSNVPLPIGFGQTISQPFIVAIMTELLDVAAEATVLEIGTGSGYQAAVLAKLARQVYSIETVPELAAEAAARLKRLGYANVEVRQGDGFAGWPEKAPFDAIIVTAAAAEIPPPLLAQLKPGGRMVVPVGRPFETQELTVVTKTQDGKVEKKVVLPVAFVPLVRGRAKAGD